ncbi:GNAT family N-acetyltransferase [Leptolyngbya ohadii]|uniref:GNAT family N-acetyltransferase n=1 Tax=Leptolyngbya ohadii TaxID=1962290 RepID=UPI000B5997A6|nr:GNAT family N-acetyltransferase [Leptolyngbya ohadii]
MNCVYKGFRVRDWRGGDRQIAAGLIASVLAEYGLGNEPDGADQDVLNVEQAYWETGGQFWVVEQDGRLVGTAGFYPIARGNHAVEIRKMYLLPEVRGQGLGRFLLKALEETIASLGYREIWIETASVLKEAVQLYENSGYEPTTGVETARCDRVYVKAIGEAAIQ